MNFNYDKILYQNYKFSLKLLKMIFFIYNYFVRVTVKHKLIKFNIEIC